MHSSLQKTGLKLGNNSQSLNTIAIQGPLINKGTFKVGK